MFAPIEHVQRGSMSDFHFALRRVMVRMVLADGVIAAEEVATIQRIYGRVTGTEVSDVAVHEEVVRAMDDERSVEDFVAAIAGALAEPERGLIVEAAALVAVADGKLDESERKMLSAIADALGVRSPDVEHLLAGSLRR
jgi:uncharacterized tellurite resistance protein B-like protein